MQYYVICYEKRDHWGYLIIAKCGKDEHLSIFCFFSSLENVQFLLHIDIICSYSWNMSTIVTGTCICSDTYKLIQNLN